MRERRRRDGMTTRNGTPRRATVTSAASALRIRGGPFTVISWLLLAAAGCAQAPSPPPSPAAPVDAALVPARIAGSKGWAWLVEKLAADGVEPRRAAESFADPRVPAFDGLYFRVEPREPHSMYRQVLTPRSVATAIACRDEFASAFDEAERRQGVSADVLAAILHVETRCGRNTGDSIVLFGLARLAMANEPSNVEANVVRTATRNGQIDDAVAAKVRARAAKLEEMFYPEVRATFRIADELQIDPLELRGSASGAFGNPQFLPTSYLRHGTDGNGDGVIDLFTIEDAAASAATFLAANGWSRGISRAEQRQVIWHYNRSDAYIDAVLGLADRIRKAR